MAPLSTILLPLYLVYNLKVLFLAEFNFFAVILKVLSLVTGHG